MRFRWAIGLAAIAWLGSPAAAQRFDNASVVALHRAGLGEAAITAKIRSMPCAYDVSTDALIALKRAGLTDAVIAAMVDRCSFSPGAQGVDAAAADPAAAHSPGIYLMRGDGAAARMELLRPSKASGVKIIGNGSILMPYVGRLILPDAHSHVSVATHRPVFYFYFPARDRNLGSFGTPESVAAQSPDEFSLVRLKVRPDQREVNIGKVRVFAGSRGIDAKDTVRFRSSEIGDAAFRVEPDADLDPGDYAFVLTGANNAVRVYDFTVE